MTADSEQISGAGADFEQPNASKHPKVLTILPTSSLLKLEEWRSEKYDLVHLNYGRCDR